MPGLRSFLRRLRLALPAVIVVAAFAVPAFAHAAGGIPQRPGGIVPRHKGPSGPPLAPPFGTGLDQPPTFGAMTYHGGRVMHTAAIHAIYWFPNDSNLPAVQSGYSALVDRFITDVAHDSGGFGNVYPSDTEYTDTTTGHILYSVTAAGSVTDTSTTFLHFGVNHCPAFDSSGNPTGVGSTCVTNADVVNEVQRQIVANGWSSGYGNLFAVFLPKGVDECFDAAGECSTNVFCAYHTGYGSLTSPTIFAVEPYYSQGDLGCDPGFIGAAQDPNGNDADVVISTLSHETNEAITDPALNAWYDANGFENGDKCAYNYGTHLGSTAFGDYNQEINGNTYFIQLEWSNALNGCYQTGTAPTISSLTPDHGPPGTVVTVAGTDFYSQTGTVAVKVGGVAVPYTVTSSTSLHFTLPSSSSGGAVTVTTIGGTADTGAPGFTVTPKITSFTPTAAVAGTTVTLSGVGFTGVDSVTFGGGVSVSPTFVSATQVKATVPPDAVTGQLVVSNATTSSDPSTAVFKPLPKVTGLSPVDGARGQQVTIAGTNLAGATAVKFGSFAATDFSVDSAMQITAHAPSLSTFSSGAVSVTTPGGTGVSTFTFAVTKVSSFSPLAAAAGATVTIAGVGLSDVDGVSFNGVPAASFTLVSSTSVRAVVPATATTGPITVTTPELGGGVSSATVFKPLPKITSVSPNPAQLGDTITIGGTNLTGATLKLGTLALSPNGGATATSLTFDVPANAVSGTLTLTTPAGSTTSTLKIKPTVTNVTPGDAQAGTSLTIDGAGFVGVSSVRFTGTTLAQTVAGSFHVVSATQLQVTVPTTAVSGPIAVANAAGAATTGPFAVDPKITSFTPTTVAAGATVTVNGSGFGASGESRTLGLAGNTVPGGNVTWVSPTQLRFVVPAGSTSGTITLSVAGGAQATSATSLTVLPPPTIDPLATAEATAGTAIAITGQNFTGTRAVAFTGAAGSPTVAAAFSVTSPTSLRVTVPNAAVTGPIKITNAGGSSESGTFTVDPKIVGFSPTSGGVGTVVTVNGSGFGTGSDTRSATVGGTAAATPTYVSPNQVKVTVPNAAVTGPIAVTVDALPTAQSATSFTVTVSATSFDPADAAAGATVTIHGAGLSSGVTDVRFGGVSAGAGNFHATDATTLTAVVPAGAVSGSITITRSTAPTELSVPGTFAVDRTVEQISLNTTSTSMPLLQDAWFRQAVAYALDRPAILTAAKGAGTGLATAVVQQSLLRASQEPGYTTDFATYSHSTAQVDSIMTTHGCTKGMDGIYVCTTTGGDVRASVKLATTTGNQARVAAQNAIISEGAAAGIEVVADNSTSSTLFLTRLPAKDYEAAMFSWTFDSLADQSPVYTCSGANNYTGYCSTNVDALLSDAATTSNSATRVSDLSSADGDLAADVPSIPLYER